MKRHALPKAAAICAALALTGTASRAGQQETETLRALIEAPDSAQKRVSGRFAATVPNAQLKAILRDLHDSFGPVTAVTEDGAGYLIRTETAEIPADITLDSQGLITSLFFHPPRPLFAGIDDALAALAAQPGTVSYLIEIDGAPQYEQQAEMPLAVGSAFKLAILKVLLADIEDETRTWNDVATLTAADKSLPTGRLQTFPDGAPFTLHTLAAFMIADSDNTATDMLMRVLGRDRVAEALGLETALSTRDFFVLKANPALAESYRAAPTAQKKALLADIAARPLPTVEDIDGPMIEAIEWHVPATRLCALATGVRTADVFTLNPGPVRKSEWQSVAYKGGSEQGVLNLTAALDGMDGRHYCLTVTVNSDGPVDQAAVAGQFAALASLLQSLP